MFNFKITEDINNIIRQGAKNRLTDLEFIENEIQRFLNSEQRRHMIVGENYYRGKHDILKRKRTMDIDGEEVEIKNLPNNRIVDNQYKKMVKQKNNHLLGQQFIIKTSETYDETLKQFFDENFLRTLKNVGKDSLNCGIGWLFVYYNESGELTFKRFSPWQIIPGWADEEHTRLDYAIRIYEVIQYEGKQENTIQKVEVYHRGGISRFILEGSKLKPDPDNPAHEPYFFIGEDGYNWDTIPLIPFKYNDEMPLINNVKSLQDGINIIHSTFLNNMEEDYRSSILVLIGFGAEVLTQAKKNIAELGMINIVPDINGKGSLEAIRVEVNAGNFQVILELLKKALIENAKGYDAKDDRLGANANQLNLKSMYNDIELDANDTEIEYRASFRNLLYFINLHLSNAGIGNFEHEEITIEFNRDMLMNESELIKDINSDNTLSLLTKLENHPLVNDPHLELERLKEQRQEEMQEYQQSTFNPAYESVDDDDEQN